MWVGMSVSTHSLQEPLAPAGVVDESISSAYYLERGVEKRRALPGDDIPEIAFLLERHLRDGTVPGFYDGQFQATIKSAPELVRIAHDGDMHHVLRVMAVMALQESLDAAALEETLRSLLISAEEEFGVEYRVFLERFTPSNDPEWIRRQLVADLSRHARFSLAKAGRTVPIREKIVRMEYYVRPRMSRLLDPDLSSEQWADVDYGRGLIFEIAYHYQQFDDYERAREWFEMLTENLEGKRETRWAHYNLACISSLQDAPVEAIQHLEKAYDVGFLDVAWMDEDGDLKSLRGGPAYEALRTRMLGAESEENPSQ